MGWLTEAGPDASPSLRLRTPSQRHNESRLEAVSDWNRGCSSIRIPAVRFRSACILGRCRRFCATRVRASRADGSPALALPAMR